MNMTVKYHCLELQKQWHTLRATVEDMLGSQPGFESVVANRGKGTYKPEYFQGHCEAHGRETKMDFALEQVVGQGGNVEVSWKHVDRIPALLWGETVVAATR